MSNKDTTLTKIHHEEVAKSVHEDAKKSLADHGSYDPTKRLMEEMKVNAKTVGKDGEQAPAVSIRMPEAKGETLVAANPQNKLQPSPKPAPEAKVHV